MNFGITREGKSENMNKCFSVIKSIKDTEECERMAIEKTAL
jgi:hypothetical protein